MRSYIELIEAWEGFLSEQPEGSLADFGTWLTSRFAVSEEPVFSEDVQTSAYVTKQRATFGYSVSNARAPQLIWKLNKILRHYSKPIFDAVELNNHDEFAILTQIHLKEECSKKEAIAANLIDRSTGIDMIKRLIKRGLVLDRVDPNDGRARLVRLSEAGEGLLYQIYQGFADIPELLVDMSSEQQAQFVATLQRLERWHSERL
jgi:DNA-binding MarR family transcriptional regulator